MSRWQKLLDESYRTLSDLKEPLGLSDERYAELAPFEERYPVLVTSYYLRLMNKLDADDPIKKMIVPDLTLPAAIDAKAQENTESVIQGGQAQVPEVGAHHLQQPCPRLRAPLLSPRLRTS